MREKLIELLAEASLNSANRCADTDCDECCENGGACFRGFEADHLLANGVTLQKWIPVSERLPEEREGWGFLYSDTVLVSYKRHDGSICITTCSTTDGKWNAVAKVTHWMPLPEPPQKGDNDAEISQTASCN